MPETEPYAPQVGSHDEVPKATDHLFTGPTLNDIAEFLPPELRRIFYIPVSQADETGPIIDIHVTRYLGEVEPARLNEVENGARLRPELLRRMVENGLLEPTAELRFRYFSCEAGDPAPYKVRFNGEELTTVSGTPRSGQWVEMTAEVPIQLVYFPLRPGSFTPDLGVTYPIQFASNTVEVVGGLKIGRNSNCSWIAGIRHGLISWASLKIKTVSPAILVHGNGAAAALWVRQGFTSGLDAAGWPWVAYDFTPASNWIESNANQLENIVESMPDVLGVDSVHLIGHSKGGLDSRRYIHSDRYAINGSPEILSLITVGTPHRGSVAADLLVAVDTVIRQGYFVAGMPTTPLALATYFASQDQVKPGHRDLVQSEVDEYAGEWAKYDQRYDFYAIAADLDRNGSNVADRFIEIEGLVSESNELIGLGVAAIVAVNELYQLLGTVDQVIPQAFAVNGVTVYYIITPKLASARRHNDSLVTEDSALNRGGQFGTLADHVLLRGNNGRDHANIADGASALYAMQWMKRTEKTRGDLRP